MVIKGWLKTKDLKLSLFSLVRLIEGGEGEESTSARVDFYVRKVLHIQANATQVSAFS